MIHSLTFDTSKQHKTKPNNPAIVSRNLQTKVETTIKEFSELVTQPIGYSFCPATFNGSRKNDNWIQQSVFCLDFDTGLEPSVGLKYFVDLGIRPNVIYTSFSDTPELRKTRFCFFINKSISCRDTFKFIQLNLMRVINDKVLASDKSCSDRARMFYPGKEVIHLDERENDFQIVIAMLNTVALGTQTDKNLQNKGVGKFIFVPPNEGQKFEEQDLGSSQTPHLSGKRCNSYIDIGKCIKTRHSRGSNAQTEAFSPFVEVDAQNWQTRKFNPTLLAKRVKLIADLVSGVRMRHMWLFGLATNLKYFSGGLNWLEAQMNAYNATQPDEEKQYSKNNFRIISFVKKMQYLPQELNKFSPHVEDYSYSNLLTASYNKRGVIERIDPQSPKISIKEAEEKLKSEFNRVMALNDTNIYIFKVATGLGKSQLLASEKIDNAVLAFPTHKLKLEIVKRIREKQVNGCYLVPQFPDIDNQRLKRDIDLVQSLGKSERTTTFLKNLLKSTTRVKQSRFNALSKQDRAKIVAFLEEVQNSYTHNGNVATTHHRVVRGGYKQPTIIFDECPLNVLMKVSDISYNDLYDAHKHPDVSKSVRSSMGGLCEDFQNMMYLRPHDFTKSAINHDALAKEVLKGNISPKLLEFERASHMIKVDDSKMSEAHFMTGTMLPDNKKIVILSATAPVEIYKLIYGDRVKVIEIEDVESVGKQIQYTKFSYSRQSLLGHKEVAEQVGNLPVITFSAYKHLFQNPVPDIHYGNCAGYDQLNGKDIAVVGTPHIPRALIVLYAMVTKQHFENEDLIMSYSLVSYNGFRFMFNTYMQDTLSKIQLALIEADMMQAVGRNRILRQNCTTHLFSNLPLKSTTEFVMEPDIPIKGDPEHADDDDDNDETAINDDDEEIVFDE